jgi:hypothetical protein
MLADWLSSLFAIDKSTIVVIATLCGAGTWILRGQLYNPLLGFAIHPLLTILCVVLYALMQASGLIDPFILTDWIKGIMAATMAGHGIGIAVGMLILVLMGDKAEAVETTLGKRQGKEPVRRTVRRDFRESLR